LAKKFSVYVTLAVKEISGIINLFLFIFLF